MQLKHEEIILNISKIPEEQITIDYLKELKRDFAKKYKLSALPSNISLIRAYHRLLKKWIITKNTKIEAVIRKRAVRSQSWIVSVQVLTKPFRCPWKCIFCPNDPSMPKSYIKSEPGAMRAFLNQFDPKKQVYNRLLSLTLTGHNTDKIEMIILWWTRDVYPDDYKKEFVKGVYDACNSFQDFYSRVTLPEELSSEDYEKFTEEQKKYSFQVKNQEEIQYPQILEESIKINENSMNRIIWLTIETRPEYITDSNCQFRRNLGVTRIEMWVQSMFDDVLKANKRWHSVAEIRSALHKLRQYGFKFSIHLMPGLYKSTEQKDIETFKIAFADPFLKPDELKFYPTSVIPNTELEKLYNEKKYIPLSTEKIQRIITKVLIEIIPPYTRIKRLIRDIPSQEIVAWSKITNLSQLTRLQMKKDFKTWKKSSLYKFYTRIYWDFCLFNVKEDFFQNTNITDILKNLKTDEIKTFIIWKNPDIESERNFVSLDTRSREIRNKRNKPNTIPQKTKQKHVNFVIRFYKSSVWLEIFISIEDELWYLYGFVRLLLPEEKNTIERPGLGKQTALIRELHIYGNLEKIKQVNPDSKTKTQHKWFGKQLMEFAEKIASQQNYAQISVISGIWVRAYYQKLWYKLVGTYMLKEL